MSVSTSIRLFFYKKTMLISSLILLVPWTLAVDYCSLCSDHTMCMYNRVSPTCGVGSEHGISATEARNIVNLHNNYRSTVATGREGQGAPGPQPSAANMQALMWDNELAKVAQRWADQCTFQHDRCRNDPRFLVGQNIYWSSGYNEPDWDRAIQSWYSEVSMFNGQTVRNFEFGESIGHYTQMVWGTTRYVGCGRATYGNTNRVIGSRPLEYILSPAGNNSETVPKKTRVYRQNLGFFGGLKPDPAGAQGALTGSLGTGQSGVQSPSANPAGSSTGNYPTNPSRPNYPTRPGGPNYPMNPGGPNYPMNPSGPNYPMNPGGPNYPTYPGNGFYPMNPGGPNYPMNPSGPNYPMNPSGPNYPMNPIGGNYPMRPVNNPGNWPGSNGNFPSFGRPMGNYPANTFTQSNQMANTPTNQSPLPDLAQLPSFSGSAGGSLTIPPSVMGSAISALIASAAPDVIGSVLAKYGRFTVAEPNIPMKMTPKMISLPTCVETLQSLQQLDKEGKKSLKSQIPNSISNSQHKDGPNRQHLGSKLQHAPDVESQLKATDEMLLQQELYRLASNRQFGYSGRQQLLVCNYGPAGNIYGGSVYQPGQPCSQCPSGTTCSNGLCA